MAEKLEFDITVKQNDLTKSLREASTYANSLSATFAGNVKTAIDDVAASTKNVESSMSSFITTTAGVAAGQIAFQALQTAINFVTSSISESVGAFAEQEDALNKLNQSLSLTGSKSESAVAGVEAFATSLEAASKFSDDAIINQVAFARSLGLTTKQAQELVQAGANLSATLGGSLEENVDKLGKTLSGSAGRLAAYIPELKNLTKAQLEAGGAAELINQKFSGAAANDLKTYSGATAQLRNSFNNLQETVGELIVKSLPFQVFLQTSKKYIDDLNASTQANAVLTKLSSNGYEVGAKTASQLKAESAALAKQIEILNAELQQAEDMAAYDLAAANTNKLTNEIYRLTTAKKALDAQAISPKVKPETPDVALPKVEDTSVKDARAKQNAELLALDAQLVEARRNFGLQESNDAIQAGFVKDQQEIERIAQHEIVLAEINAQKKEAELASDLDQNQKKLEIQKIQAEKELAIVEAQGKRQNEINKLTAKRDEDETKKKNEVKKQSEKDYEQTLAATLSQISTLQTSGNKTLVAIGKAAGLSQLAISGPVAVGKALELGPIIGPPLAVATGIAFAAQAAKIAGVAFENGGIVGQLNGATAGADNRVATVRDGEMILNANQQKNLFDMINSGGSNAPIIIQIDGVEIARAVRSQVQGGFRLA